MSYGYTASQITEDSYTYSGSTATFTPTSNLLPNTTYTATVTTGAKNLAGIPLANNYVWSFSTEVVPNLGTASMNSSRSKYLSPSVFTIENIS